MQTKEEEGEEMRESLPTAERGLLLSSLNYIGNSSIRRLGTPCGYENHGYSRDILSSSHRYITIFCPRYRIRFCPETAPARQSLRVNFVSKGRALRRRMMLDEDDVCVDGKVKMIETSNRVVL